MRYAKILEKGVITSDKPFDGSKPYDDRQPQEDGMIAVPDGWEEDEFQIYQLWKFIPAEPTESDKAEAYDILTGVIE